MSVTFRSPSDAKELLPTSTLVSISTIQQTSNAMDIEFDVNTNVWFSHSTFTGISAVAKVKFLRLSLLLTVIDNYVSGCRCASSHNISTSNRIFYSMAKVRY